MSDLASTLRVRCPECLAVFRTAFSFCPADGATLIQCVEEPLIGTTIAERYVLEELIGEGAMGLVYRASHVRLPCRYAIKILFGDLASDARMRLRFAQEAAAASQLDHPNVVTVLDFGKSDRGLLYLVMDYVQGETLAELIEREAPLDERLVIELARQLGDGLAHAHAQGIVHRDLKPDNVVLEPQGAGSPVPRILDFGLAITSNDDVFDGRLTQHGWVVGTPAYLSPEQARDQEVDQRADLYALGVVMYEMLAGVPPFEGGAMEVAHQNMLEPAPPIRARNPAVHVSTDVERVVRRLLEKNPEARFASAEEVSEALDRIDRTLDYGISEEMAALIFADAAPVAEPYIPLLDDPPVHRGRRLTAGLALVAAIGALVYAVSDGSHAGNRGEPAAHTVEPAGAVPSVALAEKTSAPAESPRPAAPAAQAPVAVARPVAKTPPVAEAPPVARAPLVAVAPPVARAAKRAEAAPPASTRRSRRSAPPRENRLPSRRQLDETRTPVAIVPPDAGVADPDTQARLAAATEPATPRSGPDVSVARLIEDYRQVGQSIARLEARGDPEVASDLRDRYFQLPYADALRIPSVRRDTLAQLAALRRDLAAAASDR